jgi:hypothetical protein
MCHSLSNEGKRYVVLGRFSHVQAEAPYYIAEYGIHETATGVWEGAETEVAIWDEQEAELTRDADDNAQEWIDEKQYWSDDSC